MNNIIPECLKGTKITDFITLTLNQSSLMNTSLLMDCAMFLNQPFDNRMLVNPVKYPKLDTINFDSEGECTNPEYIKWQQAEKDVLFKGWDKNGCYEIDDYGKNDYCKNDYCRLLYCGEYVMSFKTINDFITLCALAGIDLGRWE